ncbi:VOC family protein [Amphritea balenae]|uniref:VOC family protein n=1 Tax=Amphritea balenae TaxID=452629 RepID=A0A3P1SW15_9GAMM|nr:VOC family protein [Amphritea balenae]RRD00736.1 VOC family protein [Amphritea balenae]GGK68196.1 lactoylglutathione lyase [Amphritea balenae]
MLLGVCLGTNDLARAAVFYDRLLNTLGMVRTMEADNEVGYGPEGGSSCFWILEPFDKQPATHGNGTQVTFKAVSNDAVTAFHQIALEAGGTDDGAPGYRYRPHYFGAYCRDPDGNKLHVMHESD